MEKILTYLLLSLLSHTYLAQVGADSIATKELIEVIVTGYRQNSQNIKQLPTLGKLISLPKKKK